MDRHKKILLGVNIDHVATLRQARGTIYPDPLDAALICERAGADAITLHLREDRRHIQDRDLQLIMDAIKVRTNLEMAVTEEMLLIAEQAHPEECCLVPERREELTTEGGLDVAGQQGKITEACQRLDEAGVRVSLFIDADEKQIQAAAVCKAPVIEIHTGHYADASSSGEREVELNKIVRAVEQGDSLGIHVNAGHGLDYTNVSDIAAIPGIRELNIGHSIVSRAVFIGLESAVREMDNLMQAARS